MKKILLATAALLTLTSANGLVDNVYHVSAQGTVATQPGSAVIQVVDSQGQPIPNAKIELLSQDLNSGRQVTTDEFGNAVFSDVIAGSYVYRLVEVPEGFVLPVVATEDLPKVEIVAHESNTNTKVKVYKEGEMPEAPQPGSVVVKIVDTSHTGLAGAVVELLNEDMSQGRQVTTDEFGNAVFTDVLPGTYHYRLALAPEGYQYTEFTGNLEAVSHETVDTFIALDAVEVPVETPEAPQPGSVVVKVVDTSHTGLAGAVVELLNEDMSQGRQVTTDEFGNAVFTDVLPGTYHYRLALAPEGYDYNAFTAAIEVVSHEINDSGWIALDKTKVPEVTQAPVVSVETSTMTTTATTTSPAPSQPGPALPTTTETTTVATTTSAKPETTTSVAVTSVAKTEPAKKAQLPQTGETMTIASYALAALFVVAAAFLLLPKYKKD